MYVRKMPDNIYNDSDSSAKEDYYAELAKKIANENEGVTGAPSNSGRLKRAPESETEEIPKIKHRPDSVKEYKVPNEPVEDEPDPVYLSNDSIFPGGPLLSDVEDWKIEYPVSNQYKVCVTQIDDLYFVFRTLNRYEYKQIINMNISATGREEAICNTCTLWPFDYTHKAMADGRAGIPATYASIIMEQSGFVKEFSITEL
jgi:hypothetical protein